MKVLVTGTGSLLLGGIASELVRRGDEVVCLQRRPAAFFGHQNAREVLADICDAKAVALATQGCDAVIHGAARVGVVGSQKDFY
ncbi:MAG: NAD(P)-dependent oxidoreductase, partial [Ilumatobacteraceae bacterium]|nr:NAD(P)-dependent oxidoreductase [Ilumatobacteraceae bacterium]